MSTANPTRQVDTSAKKSGSFLNSRILAWFFAATTLVLAIVCALIYQRFSPNRAFVRVGDKTFTHSDYRGAMEYYAGEQVLKKMVYESLIEQAATKAGVLATDKEIDERIGEINRRKPKELEAANRDPAKMTEVRNTMRTNISLENLRIKDVKATDAEVIAFYRNNPGVFLLPMQIQTQVVVTTTPQNAQIAQQLLNQNIKLDVIAQKRGLKVAGINNFSPDWSRLNPQQQQQLTKAIQKTPVGRATIVTFANAKGKDYLIVKPIKDSKQETPTLAKVKPLATRFAKMVKAEPQSVTMKNLWDKGNVTFENTKYENFFLDIKNAQLPKVAVAEKTTSKTGADVPKQQ